MSYVLIIGAKSDIAKATARKYAKNGFDLYLAARNSDELEDFAKDIMIRTQRSIKVLELDILDYDSHQSFYNNLFLVLSQVNYQAELDYIEYKNFVPYNLH